MQSVVCDSCINYFPSLAGLFVPTIHKKVNHMKYHMIEVVNDLIFHVIQVSMI